ARVAVRAPRAEVRGLDDERLAFPVAARIAHVEADAGAGVRPAIERDHARLVNHLVPNRDEARALHDLERVAVGAGQHRPREPACDAAIVQTEILWAVERAVPEAAAAAGLRGEPGLRLRRERRDPAVRRIDDEPRAAGLGDFVDVAELRRVADLAFGIAAQKLRTVERVLLTLPDDVVQFFRRHLLQPAPLELSGTLERRAVLVLV